MKKIFLLTFLYVVFPWKGYCQHTVLLTEEGKKLQHFYISMDVQNNWIAGHHVVWETGQPDMPESTHGNKTHCSAFAAATCQRLGIYLLRPPEHGQILLANAQYKWLQESKGSKSGWSEMNRVDRYLVAQQYANKGYVVIAIYKNQDDSKPGHVALVMPKERTEKLIEEEGPEVIMAGTHNHNYISLKNGFASHITSWPENEIAFYVQNNATKIPE